MKKVIIYLLWRQYYIDLPNFQENKLIIKNLNAPLIWIKMIYCIKKKLMLFKRYFNYDGKYIFEREFLMKYY